MCRRSSWKSCQYLHDEITNSGKIALKLIGSNIACQSRYELIHTTLVKFLKTCSLTLFSFSIISTPSGLETWFADKVTFKDKVFTFYWGKTETRQAEVTNFRVNSFIRFRWLDDEDPKAYFELKMVYNELTSDYMLEVIDWADPDEVEDTKELWDSEIEKLKRVSGL